MNMDQAKECIRFMQGAWPWATWTDNVVAQWADELLREDADIAGHVLRVARDELDKPPTHKWFRVAAKAEHARIAPHFVALEAPELAPEEQLEHIAKIRQQIADARARA